MTSPHHHYATLDPNFLHQKGQVTPPEPGAGITHLRPEGRTERLDPSRSEELGRELPFPLQSCNLQ
jgi:hypothetical protein